MQLKTVLALLLVFTLATRLDTREMAVDGQLYAPRDFDPYQLLDVSKKTMRQGMLKHLCDMFGQLKPVDDDSKALEEETSSLLLPVCEKMLRLMLHGDTCSVFKCTGW
ncbi:hypothetical protein C0Q70_01404 [Pomacea canaliculata]|uniref:Uncharacterized protein n=1 Tax=Pomacea canaliculata TaxID=400727 RepID=A0A2T7PZD9_POMCA|nr:hypothetical protein C0Q70_01404 [Pomacea canaliculata]